mgnify:FL=1
MKLREVHVDRYGPLRETLQFDDAHVVYGPNESGKTLLVESLLLSLTGDRSAAGARVDESPEGYVALNGDGDVDRLEDGETLLDRYERRYDFEMTPAEFRNVFVVRDGDLSIAGEDDFYQRVTDRIVGVWTGDIESVRDGVLERGRLDPDTRALSDRDDAATQLDRARGLREDVDEYLDTAEEGELASIERDLYRADAERRQAEADVTDLEAAQARQEYEELVKTKGALEKSLDELAELPDAEALDDLERRLDELQAGSADERERRKTWYGRTAVAALVAGVVTGVAPVVAGVSDPLVVAAGPAAFSVVALTALGLYRATSNAIARQAAARETLLQRASEVGIDAYDLGDVRAEIAAVRDERESHSEVVQGNSEVLRTWLDIDAADPGAVVSEAADALRARKSDVDFDADTAFTEEDLDDARERAAAAEERYRQRRDELREHRRQLDEFAERPGRIEFERFCGEPLDLTVASIDALEDLSDRLDEVVAAVETDADVSRTTATVLERMADAESEKMTTLFEDGQAAETFARLTDDRYVDLRVDDDSRLVVELATGRTLSPAELSRGTRDQLYLAVRVALGRRLLDGRDGFFIMDDAFLSADEERIERQAEVVADLVDDGWQVVYLTCKRDAREALVETADAEVTELSPL